MTADPTSTAGAGPHSLVAQWYDRNPARRAPEVDFGTQWTRAGRADKWRVSWNMGTGELIAARNDQSEMEVLTACRSIKDVCTAIDGWETRALVPGGLDWVRHVTAPGIAADRTPLLTAADAILQQWSDLRTADVRARVTPPAVLDR